MAEPVRVSPPEAVVYPKLINFKQYHTDRSHSDSNAGSIRTRILRLGKQGGGNHHIRP